MFHPVRRSNFPRNPLCTLSSTSPCTQQGYEVLDTRFPLLQFLDLKCCDVYLRTSVEAVNDDIDELSHQDLQMRCKHLSLCSNCKVYVVPMHAMQHIFIILNLGIRWSEVTLKMWPFYLHGLLTHAQ